MYCISKEFHFSAAHQLSHLPEGHPCKRLHGHNYIVEMVLESEALDHRGFVTDYNELRTVKEYIDAYLDHRNLNDVLDRPTTAENLARHLFDRFAGEFPTLAEVRVSETPKTWASYRRAR